MLIKVVIVIFLSLEIESCAPPGMPPPGEGMPYDRIMKILKPAPYIEVDSSGPLLFRHIINVKMQIK